MLFDAIGRAFFACEPVLQDESGEAARREELSRSNTLWTVDEPLVPAARHDNYCCAVRRPPLGNERCQRRVVNIGHPPRSDGFDLVASRSRTGGAVFPQRDRWFGLALATRGQREQR